MSQPADGTPSDPSARPLKIWKLRTRELELGPTPIVMGIVNATPDSFSDGGKFFDPSAAIEQGTALVAQGAGIIDVGGESTRPYSQPVSEQEELRRVIPVVEGLRDAGVIVSIDTSKAAVASAAIDAGAEIINDVTGLEGDPDMVRVAVDTAAGVCAMHMQGTPQTMQDDPRYANVVEEIFDYLKQRYQFLLQAGIERERICLDPGIGFGKTHDHNLELLAKCRRFKALDAPILIGHSRKGFIGKLIGDKEASRDSGTLAITVWLAQQGIDIVRVHEVRETVKALNVMAGVLRHHAP